MIGGGDRPDGASGRSDDPLRIAGGDGNGADDVAGVAGAEVLAA